MKLWIKMAVGLVAGILIGSFLRSDSHAIVPLYTAGMVFMRTLSFIFLPLLFFTSIRVFINLRTRRNLLIVFSKSIGYFLVLTIVGAAIGITLGEVLKPGVGITVSAFESPVLIDYPGTARFITDSVPDSVFRLLTSSTSALPMLFAGFLAGMGILAAKEKAEGLFDILVSIDDTLHRLAITVLEFLPIGIFASIGAAIGFSTFGQILPFLKLILVIAAGSIIQVFIVQSLLVYFLTKLNPFKFIHAVLPAAILAYCAGNRYTAYPTLVECVENNLGADREVFSLTAGLGTALSLSGSAVAAGVTTLFVSQAYGLDLSVYLQIIVVLLITVSTLKLDGLPEGSLVLLSVVLSYVIKLPAEGYTILLGVTAIIFQIENVVNVTGNAAVSYIMAHSEESVSGVTVQDFL